MKIGLQIPSFEWPGSPANIGPVLKEIAQAADAGGFASLWVMDHFFGIGGAWGEPEAPMLEGYSAAAFMAAVTRRIRVGLMVTGVLYRHPGILVKTVSTLDVLSGGRAYFGIGAGWYERETRGLGVPFPPVKERMERLEETLQIARQMWGGEVKPYEGRHYRLEEPINRPQPLSRPHPPILIGGEGEKQTLRMVATYADACNFQLGTPLADYPEWYQETYRCRAETLPRKLSVLREHCQKVGRPYEAVEKTLLGSIRFGPDGVSANAVVEVCHELAEMGFHQVIFNIPDVHTIRPIEILAEQVIQQVSGY